MEGGIVGRTLQTFAGINGHLHVRVLFRWLSADSFRYAPRAQKLHPPPYTAYSATSALDIRALGIIVVGRGVRWYTVYTYIRRRTRPGYLKF